MDALKILFLCLAIFLVALGDAKSPRHLRHLRQHQKSKAAPPVLLEVYYETLCPDSKAFIVNQLYPTVQQINDIINVSLVPYGKATEKQNGDNWVFTCQHGPRECVGNVIQACALNILPPTVVDAGTGIPSVISLVNCMEATRDPSSAGPACATQLSIDFAPIDTCSKNSQGNQLQHLLAVRTESLSPQLYWVPWMVVNGVHNDEIQSRALYDLLGLICDTYNGPKPAACNQ
jgi:interferon gamma-inducible protein 30